MSQKPEQDPRPSAPTDLVGTLEHFRFRNADTGFAVARFQPDGGRPLTAVGQIAQLAEGQRVKLTGVLVDHPRFGRQIEVAVAQAVQPTTVEGIQAYLSSRLVKGIGPATAQRLTDTFGAATMQVIEEQPERLREVKGLGSKRIEQLLAAVRAQKDVQDVIIFLRTNGLGQALAGRIVKRYGSGASALIEADPYRLVDEVIGVGFRTADELAMRLGIAADAPQRIRAGLLHCLSNAAGEGHCYLPEAELVRTATALLGCAAEVVAPVLEHLALTNQVVGEAVADATRAVYPLALHRAETGVAQRLGQLLRGQAAALPLEATAAIARFERQQDVQLPDGQRRALMRALTEPVSVITGGPGVGKTTIIRALTGILTEAKLEVRLAAPTGRAAKRLEESTGRSASTIHRLLEYQPGINRFLRDDRDPLQGDVLVVDEASMLDVPLAYNLLRAVPPSMRLILVGDIDQLPAVGPGNVLGDIIASGRAAVTALDEIFRQRRDSRIVQSAHGILQGVTPTSGPEGSDFFVVETPGSARAREIVRELVATRIPRAFQLDPIRDVQVLCPMYRGDAGADALNRDLQEALNPNQPEIERSGHRFRLGDKVMQTRNDYELDVFNGDSGRIVRLDTTTNKLSVRYGGGRVVEYSNPELDKLVPAYAISVHRAQGSEYPAVVMPLCTEHFMMLKRNLLYTAITRARRLVVLVGSTKALGMAVRNLQESKRYTTLAERIRRTRIAP